MNAGLSNPFSMAISPKDGKLYLVDIATELGMGPRPTEEADYVAYARRGGRNAADDRIVEEIARDHDPSSLTVVTSDRELAQRARALGAQVEGAGALTRELGSERP